METLQNHIDHLGLPYWAHVTLCVMVALLISMLTFAAMFAFFNLIFGFESTLRGFVQAAVNLTAYAIWRRFRKQHRRN